MGAKQVSKLLLLSLFVLIYLFAITGCDPEPGVIEDLLEDDIEMLEDNEIEDPVIEEPVDEEPAEEKAEAPATYYWPWLSHGHLDLSSGEVIAGPDLFESELGFIVEFTEDYSYDGLLVWVVEESDVFTLDWVALSFDVDYFENNEWLLAINYYFRIEDLQPEPADEGVQEFALDLVKQEHGFEVAINKIILGKEQEGSLSAGPINYVALEIEMNVIGN